MKGIVTMKSILMMVVLASASVLYAKEYHVAKTGADTNNGSKTQPFLSIQKAAEAAQPGDIITVHEGIYREEINPSRGGTSEDKRIVYRAASGENVEIRGSEVVKNWTKETDGVWKVEVPNSLFGDFNPFADEVSGDWFNPKGRKHHTGCVYQDGQWLFEAASKDGLKDAKWEKTWLAEVGDKTTTIWAYFDGANPNDSLTEINVRQTVFYPRKPFINYITVRGFKMRHAAPKWAPPTAEQMGLIGTHWSKGWIIEDNEISHSINAGISLGKYGDKFDNAGPTALAYLDSIDRARANGWNKETIGSHIVRNNEISWCEQAGIVGSMGASFSTITDNHVHHIYTQRRFTGAEMAGIKFHAPIDMLIKGNRIHDAFQGIWLDWMTQGTRVTCNLLYRNDIDLWLEVNHGPFLIDNNLCLSNLVKHHSQGGAYVHNIFSGVFGACTDERHTPYFKAHSTEKVADHVLNVGDDRFYNNLFDGNNGSHIDHGRLKGMKKNPSWRFGYGLWIYETRPQAPQTSGNIYYDGALPYATEDAVVVKTRPDIQVEEKGNDVFLHITIDPEQKKAKTQLVTSQLLGKAQVPDLPFETPDGKPVIIDTDYFGKKRDLNNPSSGPFEKPGSGRLTLKVWPRK
jgi:alpha-N-arabinofuranosidase